MVVAVKTIKLCQNLKKRYLVLNLDVVKISVKIFRLKKISSSARQAIIVFHKCFLIHIKVADVNHNNNKDVSMFRLHL